MTVSASMSTLEKDGGGYPSRTKCAEYGFTKYRIDRAQHGADREQNKQGKDVREKQEHAAILMFTAT